MAIVLVVGVCLMIAAPLLRRFQLRSPSLIAGASTVVAVAIVGLAYQDPKIGRAAVEANRRQYLYVLACEFPVLILALVSLRNSKWAFWLGWTINMIFALYLAVIVLWLEFFWHW